MSQKTKYPKISFLIVGYGGSLIYWMQQVPKNFCVVVMYLTHSLTAKNFQELDIQLANAAGIAAAKNGVKKFYIWAA